MKLSTLQKLREATDVHGLAEALGYKASAVSFIVYKLPDNQKYRKFEIAKRSGGVREISAPEPRLRLLQRHLANLLYNCRDQLEGEQKRKPLSHGFRKRHSIVTNAWPHKRRRFVLNLDLQDYFPSFNFGRVRGFFIKNRHFALHDKVATLVAQIACFENQLPQGSPCSPIIADLITHPLDVRLAQFAKKHGLTYTRYADDLTFSTSKSEFPQAVAYKDGGHDAKWLLGARLVDCIAGAGFAINPGKTRVQARTKRQVVTGLTVNRKVNIRADHYRHARAMCDHLFSRGHYRRPDDGDIIASLNPLEGILSHINLIKDAADPRDAKDKTDKPTAFLSLYKQFLFYKYFVRPERPLVVCEGKTDNVYLHYALRRLTAFHPKLGAFNVDQFQSTISFFSYLNSAHKILGINGGTGGLMHLVIHYEQAMKRYVHRPLEHPIIALVDNDDGAKKIFSLAREKFKLQIDFNSREQFYKLCHNLFLVKTPELGGGKFSCIESMFDPALLKTELGGKKFNPAKDHESPGEYGKHIFAERVVRPNAGTIDFSGFTPLLQRLVAVIDSYRLN